jgi:hypothetical protein
VKFLGRFWFVFEVRLLASRTKKEFQRTLLLTRVNDIAGQILIIAPNYVANNNLTKGGRTGTKGGALGPYGNFT